jgi:DNA-binding transcriptional ArsR family regulator
LGTWLRLTETDEYNRIFVALKHPVRRQILLLLEEKSEASFTEIQKAISRKTQKQTPFTPCFLQLESP